MSALTVSTSTATTPLQREALRVLIRATVDAVGAAGPLGAPGGVLYAAMMAYGCTLPQFSSFMGSLERAGVVRRQGELYTLADAVRP